MLNTVLTMSPCFKKEDQIFCTQVWAITTPVSHDYQKNPLSIRSTPSFSGYRVLIL